MNSYTISTLSKIGTLERGKGLQKSDFVDNGVPCIHYGQIFTHYGPFAMSTISFVPSKVASICTTVQPGDIILALTSENIQDLCKGTVWLGGHNIVTGGHSGVFRHNQNPKYLGYFFQSDFFQRQKAKYAKGTKVIEINPEDILNKIKIKLPDFKLQQKIVEVLDSWDKYINLIDEQIQNYVTIGEYISKTISDSAFSGVGEKVSISNFLTERKLYQIKASGIPHMSLTKSGIIPKGERYNRDFLVKDDRTKKYKVTIKGDICYNPANLKFGAICRNYAGQGLFSPIYATFEIHDINPEYLEALLTSREFIERSLRYEQGTVYERKSVSPEDLLRMRIVLPTTDEQARFAMAVVSCRRHINILSRIRQNVYNQYKYLINHLISGNFDLSKIRLEKEKSIKWLK